MATNSNKNEEKTSSRKVYGVVDIVFLIDATGGMGACIDAIKKNIDTFLIQ